MFGFLEDCRIFFFKFILYVRKQILKVIFEWPSFKRHMAVIYSYENFVYLGSNCNIFFKISFITMFLQRQTKIFFTWSPIGHYMVKKMDRLKTCWLNMNVFYFLKKSVVILIINYVGKNRISLYAYKILTLFFFFHKVNLNKEIN